MRRIARDPAFVKVRLLAGAQKRGRPLPWSDEVIYVILFRNFDNRSLRVTAKRLGNETLDAIPARNWVTTRANFRNEDDVEVSRAYIMNVKPASYHLLVFILPRNALR